MASRRHASLSLDEQLSTTAPRFRIGRPGAPVVALLSNRTDDNFAGFARIPTLGATAHTLKGLKVPCSAAELPAPAVLPVHAQFEAITVCPLVEASATPLEELTTFMPKRLPKQTALRVYQPPPR